MTKYLVYGNLHTFQWGDIFTVTNSKDLDGPNNVKMFIMLPDLVSILVEVTADQVILRNTGASPIQIRRESVDNSVRVPTFIPMVVGHRYCCPTGETTKITFPCVNTKGQDVLATLTFTSVNKHKLEVSLQVPEIH